MKGEWINDQTGMDRKKNPAISLRICGAIIFVYNSEDEIDNKVGSCQRKWIQP